MERNLNNEYPPIKKLNFDIGSVLNILSINRNRDGVDMKTYTVYRVDYRTNKQELIGKVVERRREERINNAADMLRLAQKIYATSSIDSNIFIINEGSPRGHLFGGA